MLSRLNRSRQATAPTPRNNTYDQFTFMDGLTNRSIVLKDMRSCTKRRTKTKKNTLLSQETEEKELDQCLSLLKSTMSFQKHNLRQKLFGRGGQSCAKDKENEARGKKRLIRSMINNTLAQRNRQELQKYLSNPAYRPDKQLLQLSRHQNIPICKEHVNKVLNTLHTKSESETLKIKSMMADFQKDPFLQNLSILQIDMGRQLKQKLRTAGLTLVQNKNPKMVASQWKKSCKNTTVIQREGTLEDFKWQTASLENSQIKKKPRLRIWHNPHAKYQKIIEELFRVVRSGTIEEVEIAFTRSAKEAWKGRDEQGNSLLHLSAKLNRGAIFEWILRCRGVEGLLEKNIDGDTPVDIAAFLGHRQVLNHVPRSLF